MSLSSAILARVAKLLERKGVSEIAEAEAPRIVITPDQVRKWREREATPAKWDKVLKATGQWPYTGNVDQEAANAYIAESILKPRLEAEFSKRQERMLNRRQILQGGAALVAAPVIGAGVKMLPEAGLASVKKAVAGPGIKAAAETAATSPLKMVGKALFGKELYKSIMDPIRARDGGFDLISDLTDAQKRRYYGAIENLYGNNPEKVNPDLLFNYLDGVEADTLEYLTPYAKEMGVSPTVLQKRMEKLQELEPER